VHGSDLHRAARPADSSQDVAGLTMDQLFADM